MKRPGASWLLAGIVVAGSAAWLLTGTFVTEPRPKTPDELAAAAAAGPADQVAAVRAIDSSASPFPQLVRVQGHTEAWRKVEIRAETEGRVVEVPLARGAAVKAGDVIARLAIEDRDARLLEAQSLLRQRQIEHQAARELHARGHRSDTALAEAAARLDAAQAAVKRVQVEIDNTALRAPFGGILEARPAELGAYLKAGDHAATVVDLDPLRVVGHVPERDIQSLRKGMKAQAALPGGRILEGVVAFVSTVADTRTRTFRVELEVANPDQSVVEGLTAELLLPVGEVMAHVISPALLTLADSGRVGVKTVGADGTVAFSPVAMVGNTREGAVAVAGLPERATIISVGQDYVSAGQRVRVVLQTARAKGGS